MSRPSATVPRALAVGSANALSTHPVRMAAVVLLVPVELAGYRELIGPGGPKTEGSTGAVPSRSRSSAP